MTAERGYRLAELNRVFLAGRLTRDPEVRYSPAGVAVATLPLALNRWVKDERGQWKEETTFVNVSVFRRTAEVAGERLRKGSAVLVEGRLHARSWKGPDGRPRRALEVRGDRVQFLDARTDGADGPAGEQAQGRDEPDLVDDKGREAEDELPF